MVIASLFIQLVGQLLDSKGNVVNVTAPETFGVANKQDILSVGTILRAAGVDLDGPCLFPLFFYYSLSSTF